MNLFIYHPQGNTNVKESAIGFAEANLLKEFHTSIACFPKSILDSLGNIPYVAEVRRRKFDILLKPFTRTSPILEVGRLISQKAGFTRFMQRETALFSAEAVTRHLDKKVAASLRNASTNAGVYAYEDGAYFSFHEAKRRGIKCFYDLPTGYWRAKMKILEEEKKQFPGWQDTMPGLTNSKEKLWRKDEELKMADRIFVASNFTKSTLNEYPGKLPPIQVIPYGFPEVSRPKNYFKTNRNAPVKLLFVGSLSQQKGIANLFQAANALGEKVSLTLIGQKSTTNCLALNTELLKHRWIPSLSHNKVLEEMRNHDILVFPTLFDGFGLVISEAMSQGTPVIATDNCAGPDLIENGKNGWIVNAGSTAMLQSTILKLTEEPELIAKAGVEAMLTASKRPWHIYRRELSNAIKSYYEALQ